MTENALKYLRADEADPAEVEQLVLSFFGRSRQTSDRLVVYGREEGEFALQLSYNSKWQLFAATPGPALQEGDLERLQAAIANELLTPGKLVIARRVLYAAVPAEGFFRYQDHFLLRPMPPNAPRIDQLVGQHPLLLEVAVPGSSNPMISIHRALHIEREVGLICCALLAPRLELTSQRASFHWILEHQDRELVSSYRQGGYAFSAADLPREKFSSTDEMVEFNQVESQVYYTRFGIAAGDRLELPSSFQESLGRAWALDSADRERFIRASFWLQQAYSASSKSDSLALIALVSSIESLLGAVPPDKFCGECGKPSGPGPTQQFSDFVEQYVPDATVPKNERKRFYHARSAIAHGGRLLRMDEVGWGGGPLGAKEMQEMWQLFSIVRIALVNWLHSR